MLVRQLTCAFREPQGSAHQDFLTDNAPKLDDSAWDAYWGWDCAGPHGLCERVYQHLKVPQSNWQSLKHLPAVSSNQQGTSQADLIKQHRTKLDSALAKLPDPEVATASEVAQQAQQLSEGDQPTADKFSNQAAAEDERDEDLTRDLNRIRSQKPSQEMQQDSNSGQPACIQLNAVDHPVLNLHFTMAATINASKKNFYALAATRQKHVNLEFIG